MDVIIVYEKPVCSKCRVAVQMLDAYGVPYRNVRYHDKPLTREKLAELIRKLRITPQELQGP